MLNLMQHSDIALLLNGCLHCCDTNVNSMVEKDPVKRPSANDALRFPVVLRQIEVCLHRLCSELIR